MAASESYSTASINLITSCLDSIRQISREISGAMVYVDTGTMEAFQFMGAFPLLLELGARVVCSLESSSSLDSVPDWSASVEEQGKKIVIITSRLLSDSHRFILRCLSNHRSVNLCAIFTSISEIGHSAIVDSPLGPDAFHEYETLLIQDYEELIKKHGNSGSMKYKPHIGLSKENESQPPLTSNKDGENRENDEQHTDELKDGNAAPRHQLNVTVHHLPLIICPISSKTFIFPTGGSISESRLSNDHEDSLGPGLPSISTGIPANGEDLPPGATFTAQFLGHLADKLDLKLEIFSMGDTAKLIGKMMMDMSSLYDVTRRTKRTAGLLIVDRTLDLLTPCCHGNSFLDQILSSLTRGQHLLPRTTTNSCKSSFAIVKHTPFDLKIPLETIFGKQELPERSSRLSDNISSFMSAWNSVDFNGDSTDSSAKSDDSFSLGTLNGSFSSNYPGASYLEALIDRGAKDGALLIKKWLVESLQHNKMPSSRVPPGSMPLSELHTMVKLLSQNDLSFIQNRSIIQLALAAQFALRDPHSSHWDAFVSAERILRVTSSETSQNLSTEIRDFINTSISVKSSHGNNIESSRSVLSLNDALVLCMVGYILAGENFPTSVSSSPFSWEEEHSLKEAVLAAVMEDSSPAKIRFFQGLESELEARSNCSNIKTKEVSGKESDLDDFDDQWGSWDDDDAGNINGDSYDDMQFKLELRDRVDQLFKYFHKLSSLRFRSAALREGLMALNKFETDTYARKGLLYKLLSALLAKYDVPGVHYHSSAVGRLLKSGFGRLGLGQAKPSFGDQSVLLIFVVGGINMLEVREVMEAMSENGRAEHDVLLGGTALLTPDDMFELMLGSTC